MGLLFSLLKSGMGASRFLEKGLAYTWEEKEGRVPVLVICLAETEC